MIYDELMQGTPIFRVKDDGSETIEVKPPTSKEIRAARHIAALTNQLDGLSRANIQLTNDNHKLHAEVDRLRGLLPSANPVEQETQL
jgi:hypothetical protein